MPEAPNAEGATEMNATPSAEETEMNATPSAEGTEMNATPSAEDDVMMAEPLQTENSAGEEQVERNNELQENTLLKGGSYRIIKSIGKGGFGITYLAEHIDMKRRVCIKEFFLKDWNNREKGKQSVSLAVPSYSKAIDGYKQKFLKEARTLAALDHPNIVRVHDAFAENGTAYYVMEFIEGDSLDNVIKSGGALAEDTALSYAEQIASALGYMHERNLLHLDIKPQNVMIRKSDGRVILIDFGLTKHYDKGSGTETTTTGGGYSDGYAPIEQYDNSSISNFSPETDIYSLGATLYAMLAGNRPPTPRDIDYKTFPTFRRKVNERVPKAIRAAMQYNSKDRPHSTGEFLAMLPHKSHRSPLRWIIASVAVVAVVAVAAVMLLGGNPEQKSEATTVEVNVEELTTMGRAYYSDGNYVKAFECWLKAAEGGYAEAQVEVGQCYRNGRGTEADAEKALDWYMVAANQGSIVACNILGGCFFEGELVESDIKSAIYWYEQAAEQGDVSAQFNVAKCYTVKGETQDFDAAILWFSRAAKAGDVAAQLELGDIYFVGKVDGERDFNTAMKWYGMAAESGDAVGQLYMAMCHVALKEYDEAFKMYSLAAEQGNAQAQCELGACYQNGYGTGKNAEMAFYWYQKSAAQGLDRAQYSLGVCYEFGLGTKTDAAKAQELYRLAADQGFAAAAARLK